MNESTLTRLAKTLSGFSKYWEDYFTDTTVVTVDWSVNTAELTVSSDDVRPPVPGREAVSAAAHVVLPKQTASAYKGSKKEAKDAPQ